MPLVIHILQHIMIQLTHIMSIKNVRAVIFNTQVETTPLGKVQVMKRHIHIKCIELVGAVIKNTQVIIKAWVAVIPAQTNLLP